MAILKPTFLTPVVYSLGSVSNNALAYDNDINTGCEVVGFGIGDTYQDYIWSTSPVRTGTPYLSLRYGGTNLAQSSALSVKIDYSIDGGTTWAQSPWSTNRVFTVNLPNNQDFTQVVVRAIGVANVKLFLYDVFINYDAPLGASAGKKAVCLSC